MNANTKNAVLAILATDPTVTREQTIAALAALEGREERPAPGRVYSACEVARFLGVTTRTVRALRLRGSLRPVRLGASRSTGYTEESVRALCAGEALAAAL